MILSLLLILTSYAVLVLTLMVPRIRKRVLWQQVELMLTVFSSLINHCSFGIIIFNCYSDFTYFKQDTNNSIVNNTYMNGICIKSTITIARLASSLIITTALMVNYQNNQVLGISSRLWMRREILPLEQQQYIFLKYYV